MPYILATGPHPKFVKLYILDKKLASTHNDIEQELFSAMRLCSTIWLKDI